MNESAVLSQKTGLRIALLAVLVTGLLMLWRLYALPTDALNPGEALWRWELTLVIDAQARKTKVMLPVPSSQRYADLVSQSIQHLGWRQSVPRKPSVPRQRQLRLLAQDNGALTLKAEYLIHARPTPRLQSLKPSALSSELREHYLKPLPDSHADHPDVLGFITELQQLATDDMPLADHLFQYVQGLAVDSDARVLNLPTVIQSNAIAEIQRPELLLALARAAHIPARKVHGIFLQPQSHNQNFHSWAELYLNGRWTPFDPVLGYRDRMPAYIYPVSKSDLPPIQVLNGQLSEWSMRVVAVDPQSTPHHQNNADDRSLLDLTRLPLDTRLMLAQLLLLPIGVLITVVFTERLGVDTYGVFTATMLALGLTQIPMLMALSTIGIVLLISVLGRSLLPQLNKTPRLSLVFILVALGISMSTSTLAYFEHDLSDMILLLPIIILVNLVDRFYSTLEKQGLTKAITRLLWTLIIALTCLPIIQWDALGMLLLRFPELHILTMVLIFSLANSNTRRLVDIKGFQWLRWPAAR